MLLRGDNADSTRRRRRSDVVLGSCAATCFGLSDRAVGTDRAAFADGRAWRWIGWTIAGSSAGSFTFLGAAAAGVIARPKTDLRRRSTTALCAGHERGIWEKLFRELSENGRAADTQMIDSTHVKAHRSASGGKGGSRSRLWAARAAGATRRSTHSQMLKAVDRDPADRRRGARSPARGASQPRSEAVDTHARRQGTTTARSCVRHWSNAEPSQ